MALQLRRGTDAQRRQTVFSIGELIYATDTQRVYVGDGVTQGGINLQSNTELRDLEDVDIAAYTPIGIALISADGAGNVEVTTDGNHDTPLGAFVRVSAVESSVLNGVFEVISVQSAVKYTLAGPIALVAENDDSGTVQRQGSNLSANSLLKYSITTDKWEATTAGFDLLDDVDLSGLQDGDRLEYDSTSSQWLAVRGQIGEINDVTLTSTAANDVLVWDGAGWVNQANNISNLGDVNAGSLVEGSGLEYNSGTWRPRTHIRARVDGYENDTYLGFEADGYDSKNDDTYMFVTHPSTNDFKWGTSSLECDGRGKIKVTTAQGAPVFRTDKWTVQFWMKTNDTTYGTFSSTRRMIANLDTDDDSQGGFCIGRRMAFSAYRPNDIGTENSGSITLSTKADNAAYWLCSTGAIQIADNQWHHILFQHEGGGTYACFVDGVLARRENRLTVASDFVNHGGYNFGARATDDAGSQYGFLGFMDDISMLKGVALYEGLNSFTVPWYPQQGYTGYRGDSIDRLGDVATSGTATVGSFLQYDGLKWIPASLGRGDGGNFNDGTVLGPFASNIYGGGEFDAGGEDLPWEQTVATIDGGSFD